MDALDIADFGRWAKLGAYIKEHGDNGEITLNEPARVIVSMLQVSSFQGVFEAVKRFKNVTVSLETNAPVSIYIKYDNWHKYQGDFSSERVRKFRSKKAQNETPKKRGEEKRGEENIEPVPFREIIEDLNQKTGKQYRHTSDGTKNKIRARWNEGFRLEDFKQVHNNTCAKWRGGEMEQYLRPETLYSPKFESYLNMSTQNSTPGYKQRPA